MTNLKHAKLVESLYERLKAAGADKEGLGHLWGAALHFRQQHHHSAGAHDTKSETITAAAPVSSPQVPDANR